MTPYEILGVKKDATDEEILKAWRKKSLGAHPDKDGGSNEKQSELNIARDTLLDPSKRAEVDSGKEPSAGTLEGDAKQSLAGWITLIAADQEVIHLSVTTLLRQTLTEARIQNELPIAQIEQDIKVMEHRLKEVKAFLTGEENLFAIAIEGMIKNANSQLSNIERTFTVLDEIERLLNEYAPTETTQETSWLSILSI